MTSPQPDLQIYLSFGIARLRDREAEHQLEQAQKKAALAAEIRLSWADLIDRLRGAMPKEFGPYIVGATSSPFWNLPGSARRPLIIDLTPLGMVPIGAYLNDNEPGGIGFDVAEMQEDEDTGELLPKLVCLSEREVNERTVGFFEALVIAQQRADEMRAHNEQVRSGWAAYNPWAEEGTEKDKRDKQADLDLYEALGRQGGGCYPILRIGSDRESTHEKGRAAADEFGARFGTKNWRVDMAVHTFTVSDPLAVSDPDAPDPVVVDNIYIYLALIPVAPEKWREVMGTVKREDDAA